MQTLPSWSEWAREVEALAGPSSRPWMALGVLREGPGGALTLEVPSAFARDALRLRLKAALESAARKRGFTRVDVVVSGPRSRESGFSAFRVTPGNQLAYAAVTSLLPRLRPELHPLVLQGPSGCGKSHLLAALTAALRGKGVQPLVYAEVPRLAKRLGLTAREGRLEGLRSQLRTARVLILDGGEKLAGKVKLQSEVVHALDALADSGGLAVLATRDLQGLSPALHSRLQGGLSVKITT